MQYRILDRQTLKYKDGGFVRSWSIDSDYINTNNSIIGIVEAAPNASVGDLVFLIETSGAYDKGIVTSIDNEALQISYKGDKELFNDNILNPRAAEFKEDTDLDMAGVFDVDVVAAMIDAYWARSTDPFRRLPMRMQTVGSVAMYWTWKEIQIDFVDWLISLFRQYSVVVSFDIDFDTATQNLDERNAKYIVTIAAVNNDNDIIKDNVSTQTITYTKESIPEKTCCFVMDSTTGEVVMATSGRNKFNELYGKANSFLTFDRGDAMSVDYSGEDEKQDSAVSAYISITGGENYVFSWKNGDSVVRAICFYDSSNNVITFIDAVTGAQVRSLKYTGENGYIQFSTPTDARKLRICFASSATELQLESGTTPTAYNPNVYKAIYYLCVTTEGVYYITPNKSDPNRILPVRTSYVEYDPDSGAGESDVAKVAENELKVSSLNHAIEIEIPRDTKMFDFELAKFGDRYKIITKNGTIASVYSGRKESSESNIVTLMFGIGRLNFTDLLNNTLRNGKYTKLYEGSING